MLRRVSYSKEYPSTAPYFDFIKDGVRIGGVQLDFQKNQTKIWYLRIDEEFRGVGFSKVLIRDIIKFCRRVGCKKLWLNVFNDNEPALRCYRGAGFKLRNRGMAISEYTLELT